MTWKRKYSETILARCCRRSRRDCGTSSQFRSLALPVHSKGGSHHRHPDDHQDHQLNTPIMFTLITIQVTDIIITRSTRCPLAPPPRKVATVPCPLLPAMDRGKFLCAIFQKQKFVFLWKIISGRHSTSWSRIRPHSPVRIVEERWFFRNLSLLQLESVEAWEFWSLRILKLDYFEARSFLDIFFFQVLSLEEILAEGVPAQVTADHSDEDCQNDHHWNHHLLI